MDCGQPAVGTAVLVAAAFIAVLTFLAVLTALRMFMRVFDEPRSYGVVREYEASWQVCGAHIGASDWSRTSLCLLNTCAVQSPSQPHGCISAAALMSLEARSGGGSVARGGVAANAQSEAMRRRLFSELCSRRHPACYAVAVGAVPLRTCYEFKPAAEISCKGM